MQGAVKRAALKLARETSGYYALLPRDLVVKLVEAGVFSDDRKVGRVPILPQYSIFNLRTW